jgi:RNA polymerase sigma factor (sigma-70 family)
VRVSDSIKQKTEFEEKEVRKELYRQIISVINQWTRERRTQISMLEKTLPPEEIDTELYEFYQPDDIVHVEDIIPDTIETPDEEVEEEEMQKAIDHVLSVLPDKWRQAFRLIELEGFSPEEVAMIQDRSVEEVKKEVEMARAFVSEKLADLGFEWLEQ